MKESKPGSNTNKEGCQIEGESRRNSLLSFRDLSEAALAQSRVLDSRPAKPISFNHRRIQSSRRTARPDLIPVRLPIDVCVFQVSGHLAAFLITVQSGTTGVYTGLIINEVIEHRKKNEENRFSSFTENFFP